VAYLGRVCFFVGFVANDLRAMAPTELINFW